MSPPKALIKDWHSIEKVEEDYLRILETKCSRNIDKSLEEQARARANRSITARWEPDAGGKGLQGGGIYKMELYQKKSQQDKSSLIMYN